MGSSKLEALNPHFFQICNLRRYVSVEVRLNDLNFVLPTEGRWRADFELSALAGDEGIMCAHLETVCWINVLLIKTFARYCVPPPANGIINITSASRNQMDMAVKYCLSSVPATINSYIKACNI